MPTARKIYPNKPGRKPKTGAVRPEWGLALAEVAPVMLKVAIGHVKNRDLARDLVQDALEKLLTREHLNHKNKPTQQFACAVLRTTILSYWRHQSVVRKIMEEPTGDHDDFISPRGAAPANQEDAVYLREIAESVSSLPPHYQQSLVRAAEEHTLEELAIMDKSVHYRTHQSRLRLAREHLNIKLGEPVV